MNAPRFAVRVVEARKGGVFVTTNEFSPGPKRRCLQVADDLQAEFDKDCDPKRAYVIAPDGVPCAAGGVPTHWPRAGDL